MKDFTTVGLPLLLVIIAAIVAVQVFRKKNEDRQMKVIVGMAAGIAVGILAGTTKWIGMGLSVSIGMLLGEWIGLLWKK